MLPTASTQMRRYRSATGFGSDAYAFPLDAYPTRKKRRITISRMFPSQLLMSISIDFSQKLGIKRPALDVR